MTKNIKIKKSYKSNINSYSNYYKKKITGEFDSNFIKWIDKIENEIYKKFQLYLRDLPDEDYILFYENNYSPKFIVKMIIQNNFLL